MSAYLFIYKRNNTTYDNKTTNVYTIPLLLLSFLLKEIYISFTGKNAPWRGTNSSKTLARSTRTEKVNS